MLPFIAGVVPVGQRGQVDVVVRRVPERPAGCFPGPRPVPVTGRQQRLLDPRAQHVQALAAPEQLIPEHEGRHAEHAEFLGLPAQRVVAPAALALRPFGEAGRRHAGFLQHRGDRGRLLDLQFAFPEAQEHAVYVGIEAAVVLGAQHADMDEGAVEDFLRAVNGQPARVGDPPYVHVGVADPAPLMVVAGPDGAQEIRDFQRVGLPDRLDAEVRRQRPGRLHGEIGIRALDVDVDGEFGEVGHCRHGSGCPLSSRARPKSPEPSAHSLSKSAA